jgi:hypothetical protein
MTAVWLAKTGEWLFDEAAEVVTRGWPAFAVVDYGGFVVEFIGGGGSKSAPVPMSAEARGSAEATHAHETPRKAPAFNPAQRPLF